MKIMLEVSKCQQKQVVEVQLAKRRFGQNVSSGIHIYLGLYV